MRLPHHEFFAGMPARLIKDQQDPLRWACADGLGELCQRKREHIRPHGRQMLIGRPQLDRGLGKCLLHCIHLLREFF